MFNNRSNFEKVVFGSFVFHPIFIASYIVVDLLVAQYLHRIGDANSYTPLMNQVPYWIWAAILVGMIILRIKSIYYGAALLAIATELFVFGMFWLIAYSLVY